MNLDPVLLNSALLSMIIFLLGVIAAYLKKNLISLTKSVHLHEQQISIIDVVLSAVIKDSFNSKGIAEDKLPWPRIFSDRGWTKPTKS